MFTFSQFSRLGAVRAYLITTALGATGSAMAIIVGSVYLIVDAGLDPLQLILVGTVLEATVFVFENPTGVVADVHSRRTSMIIGTVLIGIAFIVVGLFPDFTIILATQVLLGGARPSRAAHPRRGSPTSSTTRASGTSI